MNASNSMIEPLRLSSGRLCLDFTNTMDPHIDNYQHDLLTSYADLVRWSLHAGLLTEDEKEQLLRDAAYRPMEAAMVFERAITLRKVISRIYLAVAHNTIPANTDLNSLQASFIEAMKHARLTRTPHGFQWEWTEGEDALDQMLWPMARSAIELLTSQEVMKVKECPGAENGGLILDPR